MHCYDCLIKKNIHSNNLIIIIIILYQYLIYIYIYTAKQLVLNLYFLKEKIVFSDQKN